MTTLLYLGHGSLRLTTDAGKTIYIDPFMSPKGQDSNEGYEVPADLVLVTHQHFDHTSIDKMLHTAECVVWQNGDAHPDAETYLTKAFLNGSVEVQAVEAYNHHHRKEECVGYVVRVDGLALFFSGDTGKTAQMRKLADSNLDYAFLPCDGIYTMTPEEAAECAALVGARHNVPVHMKPVEPYDESVAQRFAALAPNSLLVRPGVPTKLSKE
ncbi:MAG: MBL fold metallo-hydrolase [Atopobiaceae bacterium]|nr:MBL fold metallo-hydrolase [Atopobiaceae bacterium]MBR1830377.1 MBL fold metallo-hydrolase [Atopobiaceae bacterium]